MQGRRRRRAASRLAAGARSIDDRFGAAPFVRASMRKAFPDHWSFMLGEIALYCFIILIVTGIYLSMFFVPSMSNVVYHGSYRTLDGVAMSESYASTLRISFAIRGGLLIRQIHHWAAVLFVASIVTHLGRIFFTGAFRKPRELNYLVGLAMLALAAAEGFLGYSLPGDALSGTGVRIADGIILSVPIVGTYISFFLFGGQYPGHVFISRFYILHVLLVPGMILGLVTAHLMILWHQGHTQWPGKREKDNTEVGVPLYPVFMAKTGALFLFTFAGLALAAAFAQINPVWLYGPYTPFDVSAGAQPDWYVGIVEGALRMMPNWSTVGLGHTVAWNVFLPGVVLPSLFFVGAGLYPFFEQWVTGDRRYHQVLDRPRNEPTRTAIGAAVVGMGVVLLVAGGDDVISQHLDLSIYGLVDVLRVCFFVVPLATFIITRRVCVGLQRRDRRAIARGGVETGIITMAPDGGFEVEARDLTEDERARLVTRRPDEMVAPIPRHIVPLPTPRRASAQARARFNRSYALRRLETPSSYGQPGEQGEEENTTGGESQNGQHPDGHLEGALGGIRRLLSLVSPRHRDED
ncbi:MAG: cytochrome bc1 complex cytochrome b subunit [Streptosporangiaceae bacterium]